MQLARHGRINAIFNAVGQTEAEYLSALDV
jgi:hypothetical protein